MSETTNLKLFKHDNPSTNENQFDVNKALNQNWDKLDEFSGEVNDKVIEIEDNIEGQGLDIDELRQKTEQIEENISDIQQEQKTQNTEIEKLQTEVEELNEDIKANALEEETEQAKSLKITDASGARGSLKVLGNDEQDGEPSLNSSVPIKCLGSNINLYPGWEKNTISSETGEPEIDPNYIRSVDFISVLPNKNYTIKAYNIEEFGDLNTAVRMYDINKNYLSSKWIGSIISNSLTFTLTNADVRYVKIVSSNNSAVTDTAKVDIKLEEGEVATTYSPFGQGSTEIRHFNTNFLNTENINKTISGVNIESNTDKSLKITGTAAADGYGSIYNKITLPFVLKQGTKVYLNFGKDKQLQKDTNITPFVWLYSSDNTNTANINKSGSYSATLSKDTTMLTFGIENIENAKVYNENMYIVLSTENVSEYIENKDDSYILNIQQEMLTGDYFDLETKEEVHCNGKAILNGTEAWTKSGTASTDDFAMFYTNRGNIVSSGEVKSNALKYVKDYQTQDTYVTSVGEAINIRIATEIIGGNTVEKFKEFLQKKYNERKEIIAYYQRMIPVKLPCTESQIEVLEKLNKLRFYEGVNNIMTLEDIALLQAIYSVSIQTKINNVISTQLNQIGGN